MDCAPVLGGCIADRDTTWTYAHIKTILHTGSSETGMLIKRSNPREEHSETRSSIGMHTDLQDESWNQPLEVGLELLREVTWKKIIPNFLRKSQT